jgi:acetyl-CoA carboxylase biotin carboxyl carrier protein
MDMRKIRKLIELIKETGIAEIEIREGEESVRICREYNKSPAAMPSPMPIYTFQEPATPSAPVSAQPAKETSAETPSAAKHVTKSPMVGTVYLSPSPGAKPFVQVGQTVKVGDTLCLVEAMKMFNQIEADKAGTITAILVESGAPVEFGQPLFAIE